jgi:hypothetical protein
MHQIGLADGQDGIFVDEMPKQEKLALTGRLCRLFWL